MENFKLTSNFWIYEFIQSQTATRAGIDNTPPTDAIDYLRLLCANILQPLRDAFGPIYISSGYRSRELNAEIRGAQNSQHILGQAADIDSPVLNKSFFKFIRDHLPFDQLIWEFGDEKYPGWVHVSYNPDKQRGEVLRASFTKSGVLYVPY